MKLCSEKEQFIQSFEAFTVNRLIPLDKIAGLRLIVVGEELRKTTGKVVMMLSKKKMLQKLQDPCNLVPVKILVLKLLFMS